MADEIAVRITQLGKIGGQFSTQTESLRLAKEPVGTAVEALRKLGGSSGSALGHHDVENVPNLLTRIESVRTAVDDNLKNASAACRQVTEALAYIAGKYSTQEERNALGAKEVERLLTRKRGAGGG
jgi:hypothetical protein